MTVTPEQHIVTRRGNGITYAECTCGWTSGPSYSIDSAHIAGMSHRVEAYQAALRGAEATISRVRAELDRWEDGGLPGYARIQTHTCARRMRRLLDGTER